MQYLDPMPVTCDECNAKSTYPVRELENFSAFCVNCGASLRDVGMSMREGGRKHTLELAKDFFIFGVLCELDIDLDLITDDFLDEATSFKSVLEQLAPFNISEEDYKSAAMKDPMVVKVLPILEWSKILEMQIQKLAESQNLEFISAYRFLHRMLSLGYSINFDLESIKTTIDTIFSDKRVFPNDDEETKARNESGLTAFVGEALRRPYDGIWQGFFSDNGNAANYYTSILVINGYRFNPSHYVSHRLANGEASSGSFERYCEQVISNIHKSDQNNT